MFFFKQKTAYEMRISDWSSDVGSSDLGSIVTQEVAARLTAMPTAAPDFKIFWDNAYAFHHLTEEEAKSADILTLAAASGHPHRPIMFARSEERRVGKECGRTGRSGWAPYHEKQNTIISRRQ